MIHEAGPTECHGIHIESHCRFNKETRLEFRESDLVQIVVLFRINVVILVKMCIISSDTPYEFPHDAYFMLQFIAWRVPFEQGAVQ